MVRRFTFAAALLAASVLTPSPVQAAPIVDQSCCATLGGSGLFSAAARVQTFTVGLSGVMTGIDVVLEGGAPTPPATFQLFSGAFTVGQSIVSFGAPLATLALVNTGVTVPNSAVTLATVYFASLGAGLTVSPGDRFSIVALPIGGSLAIGGWLGFAAGGPSPYAGGEALTGAPTLASSVIGDHSFRTYVDSAQTPIPEPASLSLLALGLAALGGVRRYVNR